MSATFLPWRTPVRVGPRAPRRVYRSGDRRRLLTGRDLAVWESCSQPSASFFCGHGVLGCVPGFQPGGASSILAARTNLRRSSSWPRMPVFQIGRRRFESDTSHHHGGIVQRSGRRLLRAFISVRIRVPLPAFRSASWEGALLIPTHRLVRCQHERPFHADLVQWKDAGLWPRKRWVRFPRSVPMRV